jgi:hypothetical protein
VLCEALPISDIGSLRFYQTNRCRVVQGSLQLINLPIEVTEDMLYMHLQDIEVVAGSLQIRDNQYITSLSFLSKLEHVGSVILDNNPSLTDARMMSLRRIDGDVTVVRCDHLCPQFVTSTIHDQPSDTTGCHDVDMHLFLLIATPEEGLSVVNWTVASAAISAALDAAGRSESSGKVSMMPS